MKKKYGEESQVLSELELRLSLVWGFHQLAEQIKDMSWHYTALCFSDSHVEHFRPRVLRLQVLHLIENVSYFPNLLYFMKRPRPTSENIPNIMKFIGFEESILPYSKLQSTMHLRSTSLIDIQPNTVLGVKTIATKTKAIIIFISWCDSMKL